MEVCAQLRRSVWLLAVTSQPIRGSRISIDAGRVMKGRRHLMSQHSVSTVFRSLLRFRGPARKNGKVSRSRRCNYPPCSTPSRTSLCRGPFPCEPLYLQSKPWALAMDPNINLHAPIVYLFLRGERSPIVYHMLNRAPCVSLHPKKEGSGQN